MNLNLNGKVAIVTGASKGIGAGIAKAFAEEGVKVVVNYVNSKADADNVVSAIIAGGGQAIAVKGSVALADDVKWLFEKAIDAFGSVDIVVNNAGVFTFAPVEGITESEFHKQFTTNVLGPILTTQQALNYFPESGGSIINISSSASVNPGPNSRNIRVNTVAPGATRTEGAHDAGFFGGEAEKHAVSITPLGRIGDPSDVAKVVVFLASAGANWITGDRINASGGLL
jgi:3-oxoacyl-[acyl-carrier protein] reductase